MTSAVQPLRKFLTSGENLSCVVVMDDESVVSTMTVGRTHIQPVAAGLNTIVLPNDIAHPRTSSLPGQGEKLVRENCKPKDESYEVSLVQTGTQALPLKYANLGTSSDVFKAVYPLLKSTKEMVKEHLKLAEPYASNCIRRNPNPGLLPPLVFVWGRVMLANSSALAKHDYSDQSTEEQRTLLLLWCFIMALKSQIGSTEGKVKEFFDNVEDLMFGDTDDTDDTDEQISLESAGTAVLQIHHELKQLNTSKVDVLPKDLQNTGFLGEGSMGCVIANPDPSSSLATVYKVIKRGSTVFPMADEMRAVRTFHALDPDAEFTILSFETPVEVKNIDSKCYPSINARDIQGQRARAQKQWALEMPRADETMKGAFEFYKNTPAGGRKSLKNCCEPWCRYSLVLLR